MIEYDGCEHCIYNKSHKRKPLMKVHNFTQHDNYEKHVIDTITIHRDLSKSYLYGEPRYGLTTFRKTHTTDMRTGIPVREPFTDITFHTEIKYCPVCGRNLLDPVAIDHPIANYEPYI